MNLRPLHDPAEIYKQSHFIRSIDMTAPTMIWDPEAPTVTQRALFEMLTENTGRHLLDSGGAYGRHWERNQGKTIQDFLDREPTHFSGRWGLEITHDVFHWLDERVDYEPEIDEVFEKWATTGDREREPWLVCAERFLDEVLDQATGVYGDGNPIVVNTYNGEDLLSQVLQYVYFDLQEPMTLHLSASGDVFPLDPPDEEAVRERDEDAVIVTMDADAYVLLQIHGGADVRGGYTRPRVFRVMEEMAILDNACADIYCIECGAGWHTDDAYHWYANMDEPELDKIDLFSDDESKAWARAALLRVLHERGDEPEDWGLPLVLPIDKVDDVVYCPLSGHEMSAGAR